MIDEHTHQESWWSRIGWLFVWVLGVALAAAGGGLVAHAILWWATH
jgi:hypothetical protein